MPKIRRVVGKSPVGKLYETAFFFFKQNKLSQVDNDLKFEFSLLLPLFSFVFLIVKTYFRSVSQIFENKNCVLFIVYCLLS